MFRAFLSLFSPSPDDVRLTVETIESTTYRIED